jgi:hypothetical protein
MKYYRGYRKGLNNKMKCKEEEKKKRREERTRLEQRRRH